MWPASDDLQRQRHRSPAAQAQRGETPAAAASAQLVEQGGQHAGAGCADGMAERDGAAIDVDAVPVEPQGVAIGQDLGSERLVDLDQVEVVEGDPQLFNQAPDASATAVIG